MVKLDRHINYPDGLCYSNEIVKELSALGELGTLIHLTFKGFSLIGNLPSSIRSLLSLEILHIIDCYGSALPRQELPCFRRFTVIQELTLKALPELTQLPASTGALTALKRVSLYHLSKITQLLASMGIAFTALRTLFLDDLPKLTQLPFGALTSMHKLTCIVALKESICHPLVRSPL